jgi:hypothetical protein
MSRMRACMLRIKAPFPPPTLSIHMSDVIPARARRIYAVLYTYTSRGGLSCLRARTERERECVCVCVCACCLHVRGIVHVYVLQRHVLLAYSYGKDPALPFIARESQPADPVSRSATLCSTPFLICGSLLCSVSYLSGLCSAPQILWFCSALLDVLFPDPFSTLLDVSVP